MEEKQIKKLREDIKYLVHEKQQIKKQRRDTLKELEELEEEIQAAKEAREFLKDIAAHTQNELRDFVEEISTTSIDHVYPNVYQVKVEFIPKRNKTECEIYYDKNGNRIDPIFGSGHGVADMCSFGLRIAYCSLKGTEPILILDEPLRHVHPNSLVERAVDLMKELSQELEFQLIVVSNIDEFVKKADKLFTVENGVVYDSIP